MTSPTDPEEPSGELKPGPLPLALAILDALGRQGMGIVPIEPTASMLQAGVTAGADDEKAAAAIYAAMLDSVD